MSKAILLISRHAPYGNKLAKEALDAALVCAAYDQNLSLLFRDDGVFQLIKTQAANKIEQKNFAAVLQSLEYYDLNQIYVDQQSLEERGLTIEDLVISEIKVLTQNQLHALIGQQDQVLSY